MNYSKQNLKVQCRLRCDITTTLSSEKDESSSLSSLMIKSYQHKIQNLIRHQMRNLFGMSCGTIDFVENAETKHAQQMKTIILHSSSGVRRQRDEEDKNTETKDSNENTTMNKKKTTSLQYFDMNAIVERQYVSQLRAACVSCVSILVHHDQQQHQQQNNHAGGGEEHMVRVTMIGAPKRYVLQR